jgi:mediator of RNA polymerase II transcription subunit 31
MNSDFNGDSIKDQQQSERDLQSPTDVIGDEPDVVEMMDDDDDDDEEEEEEDDDAEYHSVHNNSDHDHDQITELKIKSNLLLHHHHRLDSVSNNNSNENLSSLRSSRHVSIDHESLRDTAGSHVNNNNNNNNNMESEGDEDAAAVAEDEDRKRFQIELEFVQSLANPNYLNFLAQRGYFKSETFINYLKYLMYWKKPEYCKHLMYPQCLSLLEMLQHEKFLKEIVNAACSKYIDEQILLIWLHYKTRRDWIRIDPTKLPENIEKLFQVESRLTNKDELDDDDDDGSDDKESCFGSRDRIKKKYIREDIDEDTSSNDNNTRHNFNENRLSDNSNDPFLASLFIANEKF